MFKHSKFKMGDTVMLDGVPLIVAKVSLASGHYFYLLEKRAGWFAETEVEDYDPRRKT